MVEKSDQTNDELVHVNKNARNIDFMSIQKRRPIRGMFVRPKDQVKYAFGFVGGALLSMVGMIAVLMTSLQSAIGLLVSSGRLDPDAASLLHSSIRLGLLGMLAFAIGFASYAIWAGIRLSHRIYGPMVPIKRLIGNLTAGEYDKRIRLRANDEFVDIADALNALAAKLEGKPAAEVAEVVATEKQDSAT